MKYNIYYILFFLAVLSKGFSQNTNTQNFFSLPKVSTTPAGCSANEKGYMVYNTTDNKIWYCNGTNYQSLTGIGSNFFSLDGYSIVSQGKVKLSGLTTNETSIQNKVLTATDNMGNIEWKEPANNGNGSSSNGFSITGATPSATGQSFTGNSATKLSILSVEDFDDANQFTNGTFTAVTAGTYHFDLKISLFPVSNPVPEATVAVIQVRKNGANIRVSTQALIIGGVEFNSSFNLKLAINDTIEIFAYTTAGFTMKIYGGPYLNFGGYKLY